MAEAPTSNEPAADAAPKAASADPKSRIVDALMALAGERAWDDFSIADVAERAGVSLAKFREYFPSKGAVITAYSRKIDQIVLDGTGTDLVEESAKERLFDVLMRRLDAMQDDRDGIEGIREWARTDPLAALAANQAMVNSMRFMLTAAGIDTEGPVGSLKTQGLVFAWSRVLDVWFRDRDGGLAKTMAALDRELMRGERLVARAEDLHRFASPLRSLARAFMAPRRGLRDRVRERWRPERDESREDEDQPRRSRRL
jgi:AcrR family transcriptional regulator